MVMQVLYKLKWRMPGEPEQSVLGVQAAVSALEAVLADAGAEAVEIELLAARQSRPANPDVDEPLYGPAAEAMGRRLRGEAP